MEMRTVDEIEGELRQVVKDGVAARRESEALVFFAWDGAPSQRYFELVAVRDATFQRSVELCAELRSAGVADVGAVQRKAYREARAVA